MNKTVTMNLRANNYTSRVLGVVKEKYGLNDKGEALNKFVEMFGDEFVDREVKEGIIKDVIESCNYHIKKNGFKTRTTKDLRKSIEGK
jgi:hypothetical protein